MKYIVKLTDDPKLRKCSTESPRYTDAPLYLADVAGNFFLFDFEPFTALLFETEAEALQAALTCNCNIQTRFAPSETVEVLEQGAVTGRVVTQEEFATALVLHAEEKRRTLQAKKDAVKQERAAAKAKRDEAQQLRESGLSFSKVGEQMGVSKERAFQLCQPSTATSETEAQAQVQVQPQPVEVGAAV